MVEHSKLTNEEKDKLIILALKYGYTCLEMGITSYTKHANLYNEKISEMHEARDKLIGFINER